jgi:DNA-binding beta-propeller fold protein YncE
LKSRRIASALAVVLALASARGPRVVRAAEECLSAWRVGALPDALGSRRIVCRDGDPVCDGDGATDGACTVAATLCLNVGGCASGPIQVHVDGSDAHVVGELAGALGGPLVAADTCAGPVAVRVGLDGHTRRSAKFRVQTTEAGGGRDVDRLAVICREAGGARAVVATTDFETGRLATLALRTPRRVQYPDSPIHDDAVIRTSGGRLFVVNRFLGDNIQVLDPDHGFRTLLQCSTGPGSNPNDIVVTAPDKGYVTRYGRPELWIVDPSVSSCDRFRRGSIDLSSFADGDGLPEMSQTAVVGGRLFVSVQRLDRRRGFAPTGPSQLVVIDLATDTVITGIVLHGANAFGDASGIVHEPGTGRLVLATPGDIYRVGDGGLERVDPDTLTAEGGFFVTEDALGGNILDFVLVSSTKGYAITQDAALHNHLVSFDPSSGTLLRDLLTRDAYLPDIAMGPDGLLWLADQSLPTPGLRRFDPATDRELPPRLIGVGLPPFSIGFAP